MNVETTIIDGKKYIEIDKIDIKNNTYVFLSNSLDDTDFLIRKLVSRDGKIFYEGLDSEEEFDNAMMYFIKKHENILKEE